MNSVERCHYGCAEAGTNPLSALGSHALRHIAAADLTSVGLTQICSYAGVQPNTGAGLSLAATCARLLASGSQAAGVNSTCQTVQRLSTSGVSVSVDSVCGIVVTAVEQAAKSPAAAPTMASKLLAISQPLHEVWQALQACKLVQRTAGRN